MIRGTAALVLVLGIASAQQPTLHDAWLRELLDADTKGAVAAYRAIADATARPDAERQAATARLAELQHCGAQVDAVPELLTRLPEALQQALAAAPRTPGLDAWVESAREGTDKLVERVRAAERGQPRPVSRPLLEPALRWIEQQSGPGSREQRRRLLEQLQRARIEGDGRLYMDARRQLRALAPTEREERLSQIAFAQQVLRRELGDSPEGADRIRQLRFPEWKPPELQADPATALARALANLEQLLASGSSPLADRDTLVQLQARLRALAAGDPGAALAFLRRLPLFAEELLR